MSLTQQQKDDIRNSLNTTLSKTLNDDKFKIIIQNIESITSDPPPEKILTCSRCGKNITAYGINGQSFRTEYTTSGEVYYHGNLSQCII